MLSTKQSLPRLATLVLLVSLVGIVGVFAFSRAAQTHAKAPPPAPATEVTVA
jgi:hypothetical protein